MIFFSTFLYYVCFASSALIYGIGLNRVADLDYYSDKKLIYFGKIVISIFLSTLICSLITNYFLVPLNIQEIYPIVCLIFFVLINSIVEGIVRLTTGVSTTEFVISFIVVLLSVSESTSALNAILISGSCLLSLGLLIPIIIAFKKRIHNDESKLETYLCRFFILIAIIILIISSFDIMWLNNEVIK